MSGPLKWKLLAGFLLVFIAGLAAGAFIGAMQSRYHGAENSRHRPLAQRVRARMQTRLGLTSEQMARTAPIFDKTARQLEAIRSETARRVHETLAAADRELAPSLTPEQRAKLDALEEKHEAEREPSQAAASAATP